VLHRERQPSAADQDLRVTRQVKSPRAVTTGSEPLGTCPGDSPSTTCRNAWSTPLVGGRLELELVRHVVAALPLERQSLLVVTACASDLTRRRVSDDIVLSHHGEAYVAGGPPRVRARLSQNEFACCSAIKRCAAG
jgi:hypothetical protein